MSKKAATNPSINPEWKCIRCKQFPKTYTFKNSGYFLPTLCEYCFDKSIDAGRKEFEKELAKRVVENADKPSKPTF